LPVVSWPGPTDPSNPPAPRADGEDEAGASEEGNGAADSPAPPAADGAPASGVPQYRPLVPHDPPPSYMQPHPGGPPSFGPTSPAPGEPASDQAATAVETIAGPPSPPADTPEVGEEDGGGRRRWRKGLIEWGVILAIAVAAAFVIRIFLIEPFFIPTGSMEPTLDVHDRVLVNKLSYHLHGVHRGDIIVFAKPANDNEPGIKDLVKRVIGLPGDRISSGPNGEILIDGQAIKQRWLTAQAKADPGPPVVSMTIPAGEYFVMGDNRGDSSDSRVFGPIPRHLIVGRAFVIVWPLSRFGGL
jgi:signal peptidase I